MDSVLQILLFGGLMFLMMRFGCGAHMFGRGRGHGKDAEAGERGGCCGNAAGGNSPADKKADENTIIAEIVTVDNSLVDRFEIDRKTGRHKRVK